ncbi:DUF317 domain-containing protein [Kitasatospora sp. NPDC088783]|uniref:DUF317 domain-containing protein n=1 Tax=Kitasatospora sp. NPDC088783 TaxID=3364077 RepID=UPI00380B10D9
MEREDSLTTLRSPCASARLEQPADDNLWFLVHTDPESHHDSWSVTFTAGTPAEILRAAALTVAHSLRGIAPTRLERLGVPRSLMPGSGWTLREHWSTSALVRAWTSPDRQAVVEFDRRPSSPEKLTITVKSGRDTDGGWTAAFEHDVPNHVVNAALELTVGDRSAVRPLSALPAANLTQLSTPTPAGGPIDRRSAALSLSRPVRLPLSAVRPPSPQPPAPAAPAAEGRRR